MPPKKKRKQASGGTVSFMIATFAIAGAMAGVVAGMEAGVMSGGFMRATVIPASTAEPGAAADRPDSRWASAVIGFSSQYPGWEAIQALGAPNTSAYGDLRTAWAPNPINGGEVTLSLGFSEPVPADGLLIRETYGNGFVTKVDLLYTDGTSEAIWREDPSSIPPKDPSQPGCPVDFVLRFRKTSKNVKGVTIHVNTDHNAGAWEEIDAVQLNPDATTAVAPCSPGQVAIPLPSAPGDENRECMADCAEDTDCICTCGDGICDEGEDTICPQDCAADGPGTMQEPAAPALTADETMALDQILAQFKTGMSDAQVDKLLAGLGSGWTREAALAQIGFHVVGIPASVMPLQAVARLGGTPGVVSAVPDIVLYGAQEGSYQPQVPTGPVAVPPGTPSTPNPPPPGLPAGFPDDPSFSQQWPLGVTHVPNAWPLVPQRGAGVKIAIADTGVGPHPDLRIAGGWNVIAGSADTNDTYVHGTAVAGVAAATINNDIALAGVSDATIVPYVVAFICPVHHICARVSDVVEAIERSEADGVRIFNASFAPDPLTLPALLPLIEAAQAYHDFGGIVTWAAGNTGNDLGLPAFADLLPVAAVDSNGVVTAFSSYGEHVMEGVAAPGDQQLVLTPGGGTTAMFGTSFAAPHVAGIAALVWSAKPCLSNTQVESIIRNTATDDAQFPGQDVHYGYGIVNAQAAVTMALSTDCGGNQPQPPALPPAPPNGGITADDKGWQYDTENAVFEWYYHWIRSPDGHWAIVSVGKNPLSSDLLIISGTPDGAHTVRSYPGTITAAPQGFNVHFTGASGVSYTGTEEGANERVIIQTPEFSLNVSFSPDGPALRHGDVRVNDSVVSPNYYSLPLKASGNMTIGGATVVLDGDPAEHDHQYGVVRPVNPSAPLQPPLLNHDWLYGTIHDSTHDKDLAFVAAKLRNPNGPDFANQLIVRDDDGSIRRSNDAVFTPQTFFPDGFSKEIRIASQELDFNMVVTIASPSSAVIPVSVLGIMQENGDAVISGHYGGNAYSGFGIKESTNRGSDPPASHPGAPQTQGLFSSLLNSVGNIFSSITSWFTGGDPATHGGPEPTPTLAPAPVATVPGTFSFTLHPSAPLAGQAAGGATWTGTFTLSSMSVNVTCSLSHDRNLGDILRWMCRQTDTPTRTFTISIVDSPEPVINVAGNIAGSYVYFEGAATPGSVPMQFPFMGVIAATPASPSMPITGTAIYSQNPPSLTFTGTVGGSLTGPVPPGVPPVPPPGANTSPFDVQVVPTNITNFCLVMQVQAYDSDNQPITDFSILPHVELTFVHDWSSTALFLTGQTARDVQLTDSFVTLSPIPLTFRYMLVRVLSGGWEVSSDLIGIKSNPVGCKYTSFTLRQRDSASPGPAFQPATCAQITNFCFSELHECDSHLEARCYPLRNVQWCGNAPVGSQQCQEDIQKCKAEYVACRLLVSGDSCDPGSVALLDRVCGR